MEDVHGNSPWPPLDTTNEGVSEVDSEGARGVTLPINSTPNLEQGLQS